MNIRPFYIDHNRPFYGKVVRPMPEDTQLDYGALSLSELQVLLKAHGKDESDIVSDSKAHWKTRHKELVAWFEGNRDTSHTTE